VLGFRWDLVVVSDSRCTFGNCDILVFEERNEADTLLDT
ncbi:MAG: hypothetical protein ACJAUH_002492, partial [Saprospiraceae bacterium]